MGPAPLRSDSCNTCRKRKVKCDLQHPHCARCLRGGHHCEGYDRLTKFVHTFAKPIQYTKRPVSQKSSKDNMQGPRATLDQQIAVINVNAQIRSQLFSLFIDSYIPLSPIGQVSFRCRNTSNLIEAFPSLMNVGNSQLLDRAMSALATVFVGKKFHNFQLIHYGIMLYNDSIRLFSRLIPRAGPLAQEVLCANVVFQLYEVINCTSGFSGWMAHMQGANAVVALHEKSLVRDPISTMLLRQLKLSNVFHAIGKSKSALHFCPMWQTVTSSTDGAAPVEPIDEVIDILLKCTIFIEYIDSGRTDLEPQKLMDLCCSLKKQTESWHRKLQSKCPGQLYTIIPNRANVSRSAVTENMFSSTFHFETVEIAEAYMLYWVVLLILHSLFHGIELRDQSSPEIPPQLPDAEYAKPEDKKQEATLFFEDPGLYADKICCGVGYFLQPQMHILGGHNLLFPTSMAAQFFYRNGLDDRYLWCQETFAALESIGLGLAHVLQGTPWSKYKSDDS